MCNNHVDHITVDLDIVRDKIAEIGKDVFSTIDILELYQGGYYSNKGVNVDISFNAQFGKFLSRNAEFLGIEKFGSAINSKDDLGNSTTTQMWQKVDINTDNKL